MTTWQWVTVIAISVIFPSAVLADTIITFAERNGAVDVLIDGTKVTTVTGERADTTGLNDPGFLKGPLGRRLCLGCPQGLFGAALFEPGTSELSDVVFALVVAGGVPPEVDSEYYFASDPDISALANDFRDRKGLDLLDVLATKAPKTFETGEEQVLQFFDLNGVPTPLPSGPPIPFFFTGGPIVIKAKSDIFEIPETTTLLLFGTTLTGMGLA
jgi:hypothetical protein